MQLTKGQERILASHFFDQATAKWWYKELSFQLQGHSVMLETRIIEGVTVYSLTVKASPEGNAH